MINRGWLGKSSKFGPPMGFVDFPRVVLPSYPIKIHHSAVPATGFPSSLNELWNNEAGSWQRLRQSPAICNLWPCRRCRMQWVPLQEFHPEVESHCMWCGGHWRGEEAPDAAGPLVGAGWGGERGEVVGRREWWGGGEWEESRWRSLPLAPSGWCWCITDSLKAFLWVEAFALFLILEQIAVECYQWNPMWEVKERGRGLVCPHSSKQVSIHSEIGKKQGGAWPVVYPTCCLPSHCALCLSSPSLLGGPGNCGSPWGGREGVVVCTYLFKEQERVGRFGG
jgi:hypothetical protein